MAGILDALMELIATRQEQPAKVCRLASALQHKLARTTRTRSLPTKPAAPGRLLIKIFEIDPLLRVCGAEMKE
jgi:hypothetical protein